MPVTGHLSTIIFVLSPVETCLHMYVLTQDQFVSRARRSAHVQNPTPLIHTLWLTREGVSLKYSISPYSGSQPSFALLRGVNHVAP